MKKKSLIVFSLLATGILLSGCAKWIDRGESITAVGSSALQPLVESAADEYQTNHPGEFINVQGGGSGTGLSQVQSGAVDIGNSDLFAEEKSGIDANKLTDHQVAVVGITPIINKKVGVDSVTMAQLKQIFTGEITNWKEVGGADQDIVLLNRASGSGTRATFEKWVLDGASAKQSQEQDSSGMVRQIVSDTPGAISYVAFSYVNKDVQKLKIDNIEPNDENVKTNKWIIWSYEHMYTHKNPTSLTTEFIEYILSDKVQEEIVGKMGYIPVTQMEVKRDWKGNIIK
ncbi:MULTISPECIES: phosphate ABC transporter substrate-binding protein PstS [Enterococcus]|uniref:Phosphate-binding protein n=1 Tax=Enterococcus sulfureus ATCC 49903 TaxID=1140003 RepID=S0P6Q9_9ENTE|nr:phosphate ABC transporter substrate-binding protein PstS [Enterococcus sulfureus]EOT47968.1 phosphate binding protein [Enterococcus sulfureus ATCC 49903]EOT84176.1 phosphate binding protein [Enterococcus sulfureus ATCC 49903]